MLFNKTWLCVAVLFFAGLCTLSAQNVEELYSPYIFSSGVNTVSFESPMSDIFNPAASGLRQRATLDLNDILLAGLGTEQGVGNAINLGLTIPTRAGVWSSSLHFITAPFANPNIGTLLAINTSFAKDLFPNFLLGIGVSGILGTQSGVFDWGLGADIGFIHIIDKVLFLSDFTWGFAFRGLGKGYLPTANNTYLPKAFTPSLGMSFKIVKIQNFYWSWTMDISVPDFAGVKFDTGTELGFFDIMFIRANLVLDSFQLGNAAAQRVPLSFGISFIFKTDIKDNISFLNISERGWNRSDIELNAAYAPLANGIHAFGLGLNASLGVVDKNPPAITMKVDKETDISPNFDGVKDELTIPMQITDERYVMGYRLVIMDSAGKIVKEIANKEERPENVDVNSVLQRLVYVRSGIKIPASLVWDGKSASGTLVPDGAYSYYLEAWDDNNNKGKTDVYTVNVDVTPPKAALAAPYLIFSPNGNSSKADLPINISGSKEDLWQLQIKDAQGAEVLKKEWKDGAPSSFAWDGKNTQGTLCADGIYSLSLDTVDKAGNKAHYQIDNIIIDTQQTQAFVTVGADGFSPNADGFLDTINFSFYVSYKKGVKSWSFVIGHDKQGIQKTLKGQVEIPDSFTWDGKTDAGTVAPDGVYTGILTIEYDRGTLLVEKSKTFVLNVAGPAVDLSLNLVPFSPDNDGMDDELSIMTKVTDLSPIAQWKMEITDPTGVHFTSFSGTDIPKETIVWDGKSDRGEVVEAATDYKLELSIADKLGNKATLSKVIMVDVLVFKDGDKLRIRVPSITFQANTDDYVNVASDAYEKNKWTLGRLAEIFKKYRAYNILIEGHAVSEYYYDAARAKEEQEKELLPLSKKRAEAVKQALVLFGIVAERITTEGMGAARPIVPFSDLENRWKDRRVEFILIKK